MMGRTMAALALAALVAVASGVAVPVVAQTGPPARLTEADQTAIRAVIKEQIAAFQRDDGSAAFALASPGIQRQFGTPANFMAMVRSGYQPVYRPRRVEFREVVELFSSPTQKVLVIGPDGLPVLALYPMAKQPDGSWRTDGCYLVRMTDLAA